MKYGLYKWLHSSTIIVWIVVFMSVLPVKAYDYGETQWITITQANQVVDSIK